MKKRTQPLFLLYLSVIACAFFISACNVKSNRSQTSRVQELLQKADKPGEVPVDSALAYLTEALYLSSLNGSDSLVSRVLIAIGNTYTSIQNPYFALGYFEKAEKHAETYVKQQPSLTSYSRLVRLYNNLGCCYYELDYPELATEYFIKTSDLIEELQRKKLDYFSNKEVLSINLNISSMYVAMKKYPEAQALLTKIGIFNKEIQDSLVTAYYLSNQGVIYKEKGKFDEAYDCFSKSLEIHRRLNDPRGLAALYNNLSEYYFTRNDKDRAIEWSDLSVQKSLAAGITSSLLTAYQDLAGLYAAAGKYDRSYDLIKKHDIINDSLDQLKKANSLERLKTFQASQSELLKVQAEIKRIDVNLKNSRIINMLALILSSAIIIIISILIKNRNVRLKAEQLKVEKLELEHQKLELERINIEQELTLKNNQLQSIMHRMNRKNQFLDDFETRVKALLIGHSENQLLDEVTPFMRELRQSLSGKLWKEFEMNVKEVFQDFSQRLYLKFPDLTPNEKKLCTFLRMNLSTKEIASITKQSPLSIKIARSRLRKKLGLSTKTSLITFLETL